jgi:hypothetical protein
MKVLRLHWLFFCDLVKIKCKKLTFLSSVAPVSSTINFKLTPDYNGELSVTYKDKNSFVRNNRVLVFQDAPNFKINFLSN